MIITTTDANTGKPLRLRLAPGDIEEAIARCGWTILNTAGEVSDEDTAEVAPLAGFHQADDIKQNLYRRAAAYTITRL